MNFFPSFLLSYSHIVVLFPKHFTSLGQVIRLISVPCAQAYPSTIMSAQEYYNSASSSDSTQSQPQYYDQQQYNTNGNYPQQGTTPQQVCVPMSDDDSHVKRFINHRSIAAEPSSAFPGLRC
jgi:hypothetical protein